MADQAITALPKKTYSGSSKIAATDYLLGIDSAEGYQMLIQDLGEYIINKVTASLAGSNQTLAAAISALNSKTIASMLSNNADLDDYQTQGVYYGSGNNQIAHKPSGVGNFALEVIKNAGSYCIQRLTKDSDVIYTREYRGSSWTDWVKQPARAEVDALNSKISFYDLNSNVKSANLTFFEHLQTIPNKSVAIYNGYAPEYVPSDIPTWATASITILAFKPTNSSDTIHLTALLIASNGTAGIMYGRGQWKQIVQ